MFSVNDILTAAPDKTAPFDGVVRIVAVSEDGNEVALMRLDLSHLRAPFNRPSVDISSGLRQLEIVSLEFFDPNLAISEDQLSPAAQEKLQRALELMLPLLGDDHLILDSKYRGRIFRHHAKTAQVSVRTIRRHFYDYLWGGMTKLALSGIQKKNGITSTPQKNGTKRRGPKSSHPEKICEVALPEVRESLEKGARIFYLPGKYTQMEAYVETLKKYFSKGKEALKDSNGKTKLEDILVPAPEQPTYRQFRYLCELLEHAEGKRKITPRRQPGDHKEKKAQRGRARHGVAGPGYRYEIDATKLQVQLVSRYGRRNLVSEATLYIIIDVWSGAIVGYTLSLNNASWALAAKSLRNCFTDKGKVFERLGLPYSSRDWPSRHLPSRLAADRAELVSNKAGVVPEIGIKVEIMPPMCPERKGKVESEFNAVKHGNNYYSVPGRHKKNPGRRKPDGKDKAALTLEELEFIIVEIIIDLNNDPVPIEHIPAEVLKAGYNAVTHGGLFEWGLEHRAGFTRTLPAKDVFTNLMTKETASVTSCGISFKQQNFVSERLIDLGYTARAANKGAFDIEIRYDDNFADQIWFHDEFSLDWVPALNDNEEVCHLKSAFFELEDFLRAAKDLSFQAKKENIHQKSEKSKRINAMTKAASREAQAQRKGMPKSQVKASIRLNKKIEQQAENLILSQETLTSFAGATVTNLQEQKPELTTPIPSSTAANPHQSVASRSRELWKIANDKLDK
jgi:hypothetical protein